MDIVLSEDGRDFVSRDWSTLVTADPAGTFFHTPQFLKLYWEEFGQLTEHLLLAFAEENGGQVGAVAFERAGTTLRFLGGTEGTDYMGPGASPGSCSSRSPAATTGRWRISAAWRRTGRGWSVWPKRLRRKDCRWRS